MLMTLFLPLTSTNTLSNFSIIQTFFVSVGQCRFFPLSFTLAKVRVAHRTRVRTAMSSKMQSSSSLAHHKRVVQQLRREACIDRIKVADLPAVFL